MKSYKLNIIGLHYNVVSVTIKPLYTRLNLKRRIRAAVASHHETYGSVSSRGMILLKNQIIQSKLLRTMYEL